jgi:hypothetical protein
MKVFGGIKMNDNNAVVFNIIWPELFLSALMMFALIKYPEILSHSIWICIITFAGIIIYTVIWVFIKPDKFSRNGGVFIGFLFMLNIYLEDFINWPDKTSALVSTLVMMFLIFISFSIISGIKTLKTRDIYKGIKSSFISSLLGTIIALCFGFLICYLFADRLAAILANDPGFNEFANPITFTFYNAFDNASNHILMVPIVSTIMGILGAVTILLILKLRKQ